MFPPCFVWHHDGMPNIPAFQRLAYYFFFSLHIIEFAVNTHCEGDYLEFPWTRGQQHHQQSLAKQTKPYEATLGLLLHALQWRGL